MQRSHDDGAGPPGSASPPPRALIDEPADVLGESFREWPGIPAELLTGAGIGVQPPVSSADLDGFAADRESQPGDPGDDVERAPGHPCQADGEPEARQSLAGELGDAGEAV